MVLPVASGSGSGTGGTGTTGDKDKDEQQLSTADRIEELTSPTALRKLVLNYLLHHCYIDTAHAFARDGAATPTASTEGLLAELEQERETARGEAAAATPVPSVGYSSAPLSGSTGGSTPRAGGSGLGSRGTHPLSAPPLSRQDSSMEVEGDHLLAPASSSSIFGVRSGGSGTMPGGPGPIDEDAEMGEAGPRDGEEDGGSAMHDGTNGNGVTHSGELGSELSDEDLQSVRLRQGKSRRISGRLAYLNTVSDAHIDFFSLQRSAITSSPVGYVMLPRSSTPTSLRFSMLRRDPHTLVASQARRTAPSGACPLVPLLSSQNTSL